MAKRTLRKFVWPTVLLQWLFVFWKSRIPDQLQVFIFVFSPSKLHTRTADYRASFHILFHSLLADHLIVRRYIEWAIHTFFESTTNTRTHTPLCTYLHYGEWYFDTVVRNRTVSLCYYGLGGVTQNNNDNNGVEWNAIELWSLKRSTFQYQAAR